jgi:hypothetical protein
VSKVLQGGARQISGAYARALVEARLGRPSQDVIEAAVVLEAWGGLAAQDALAAASDALRAEFGAADLPEDVAPSVAIGGKR